LIGALIGAPDAISTFSSPKQKSKRTNPTPRRAVPRRAAVLPLSNRSAAFGWEYPFAYPRSIFKGKSGKGTKGAMVAWFSERDVNIV
jgi:hypothetical protein